MKKISPGSGDINNATVTLKWSGYLYAGSFDFKVFGIEMVYVPQGSFYIGDGASYNCLRRGDKNTPYYMQSENSIGIGNDSASLIDTGASAPAGSVPSTFPKGYNGFYCMKHPRFPNGGSRLWVRRRHSSF